MRKSWQDIMWARLEHVAAVIGLTTVELAKLSDATILRLPGLGRKSLRLLRTRYPQASDRGHDPWRPEGDGQVS